MKPYTGNCVKLNSFAVSVSLLMLSNLMTVWYVRRAGASEGNSAAERRCSKSDVDVGFSAH